MAAGGTGLPVTAAWAKAGQAAEPVPHPLVCHLIDTAAVADELYDVLLGPSVRTELEACLHPLGPPRSVVAVLCGLHDLGKLSPAFQTLRPDVAHARLPAKKWVSRPLQLAERAHRAISERTDLPHGVATAAHMAERLRRMGVATTTANEIASVIGGHHGTLPAADEIASAQRKARDLGTGPWTAARDELIDALADLWDCPWPESGCTDVALPHPAAIGLAGLTTMSDWIASNSNWFEPRPEVADLAAYRSHAVSSARRAIADLGWQPWRPGETSCSELFPDKPNELQHTVEDLVADRNQPGVLTVEAPTGEGKTRAALQAAAAVVQRQGLSGIYVGMPTKATSRQVRSEVDGLLERQGSPLRANVVYSGTAAERNPKLPVRYDGDVGRDEPAPGDDDESPGASEEPQEERGTNEAREWFTKKRGLAAPIGVGTIDQALQAVIRSRHNFLRLACLSGKVLILDEVHSYETYTSTLLDRLLWWCGRLGITVILMSATLAATRREELIGQWRSGRCNPASEPEEPAVAQPGGWRATWCDGVDRPAKAEFAVSAQNPLVLHWVRERSQPAREDAADFLAWLHEHIGEHGCAAIIHNTVKRAKATFELLKAERAQWQHPPELFFLTGQLDAGERVRCERELQEKFGAHGAERRGIVVGTQVLEQSLDLDFDVMLTDPCPVDLIVQRAGRLHRHHGRDRPVTERVLGVFDPRPEEGARRKDKRRYRFESNVYRQYLSISTVELLRAERTWNMPAAVPKLVHSVYVDELRPEDEAQHEQWAQSRWRFARTDHVDAFNGEDAALRTSIPSRSLSEFTARTTSPSRTRKDRGDRARQEQR
ncbi:CRISPR-associated helicase Cas3' [Salinifilum ghardaiensis]